MKYFKLKANGVVLGVDESVKTGDKSQTSILSQYESRPELYTPCDKDGNPLKATAKAEGTASKEAK